MAKKYVTTQKITHDKEGNVVVTTEETKKGSGCLTWLLGAFLVLFVAAWPLTVVHGWMRWVAAAGWWFFLFCVYSVVYVNREKKGQEK